MATRAMRIEPGPNQESVWDNPRPPRIQRLAERLEVIFSGCWIADTSLGYRNLGACHPLVHYRPPWDVQTAFQTQRSRRARRRFEGDAAYYSIDANDGAQRTSRGFTIDTVPADAGTSHSIWKYWIGGERVQPQSDDFYRGLSWIVCPFNAAPEPSLGNSIYGVP
jgi:uncharacterized protein (DUF427 family)